MLIASTAVHPLPDTAPALLREGEGSAPKGELDRHLRQERVRASTTWALDEYATTLASRFAQR